jgi:hypothetical protein
LKKHTPTVDGRGQGGPGHSRVLNLQFAIRH